MKTVKKILIFCIATLAISANSEVITYTWPTSYSLPETNPVVATIPIVSDKYKVTLWQNGNQYNPSVLFSRSFFAEVNAVRATDQTFSFSQFSYSGEVIVEVESLLTSANATRVEILPAAYGINPISFDGKKVKFKINRPGMYLSVNFIYSSAAVNTSINQTTSRIKHGLMLFGDPVEQNPVNQTDAGVVVYSNQVTNGQLDAASTIYFPPGVWDLRNRYTGPTYQGVMKINTNNKQIYIAGGAVVFGGLELVSSWSAKKSIKIKGRGVFSGAVYRRWGIQKLAPVVFNNVNAAPMIELNATTNNEIEGVCFLNTPFHLMPGGDNSTYSNIKIIGWEGNSDGIRCGGGSVVNNVFIRTEDDYFYTYGIEIKNSVFWPTWNGAVGTLGWGPGSVSRAGDIFNFHDNYIINSEAHGHHNNRGVVASQVEHSLISLGTHNLTNIELESAASSLFNIHFRDTEEANPPAGIVGKVSELYVDNMRIQRAPYRGTETSIYKQEIRGNVKNGKTYLMQNMIFTDMVIGNQIITEENKANYFNIGAGTNNVRFLKISTFKNINVNIIGSGKVYPEGTIIPVRIANNQTFSIVPNSGQRIKEVIIDGVSQGRMQNIVLNNLLVDKNIEVIFEAGNDYFDLTSTNINSTKKSNSITAYYNQNTKNIEIGSNSQITNSNLQIIDLTGKVIYKTQISSNKTEIPVRWKSGCYIIDVSNRNGLHEIIKLIF